MNNPYLSPFQLASEYEKFLSLYQAALVKLYSETDLFSTEVLAFFFISIRKLSLNLSYFCCLSRIVLLLSSVFLWQICVLGPGLLEQKYYTYQQWNWPFSKCTSYLFCYDVWKFMMKDILIIFSNPTDEEYSLNMSCTKLWFAMLQLLSSGS